MGINTKFHLIINLSLLISILGLFFPTLYQSSGTDYWVGWSSGLYIYFINDVLIVFHPGIIFFPIEITSLVLVLQEEYNSILLTRGWKKLNDIVKKWKKKGLLISLLNIIFILGNYAVTGGFFLGICVLNKLSPFIYVRLATGPLLLIGYSIWYLKFANNKKEKNVNQKKE